jgi:hypothetical protein
MQTTITIQTIDDLLKFKQVKRTICEATGEILPTAIIAPMLFNHVTNIVQLYVTDDKAEIPELMGIKDIKAYAKNGYLFIDTDNGKLPYAPMLVGTLAQTLANTLLEELTN